MASDFQGSGEHHAAHTDVIIWLRLSSAPMLQVSSMGQAGCRLMQAVSGLAPDLSLMVWILKREVRAFGGCLGMYRRRRTWHAAISVGEL